MMKKLFFVVVALFMTACSTDNKIEQEIVTSSTEENQALIFKYGEKYQFQETDLQAFSVGQVGLKMSVDKVEFDETIDLTSGYPEEEHSKFEGKIAVVVTTTFENPTDHYIDLVGEDVIDSEGRVLEYTYVGEVSSLSVDGINAGQKISQTNVYLGYDTSSVQVNYTGATWQD